MVEQRLRLFRNHFSEEVRINLRLPSHVLNSLNRLVVFDQFSSCSLFKHAGLLEKNMVVMHMFSWLNPHVSVVKLPRQHLTLFQHVSTMSNLSFFRQQVQRFGSTS